MNIMSDARASVVHQDESAQVGELERRLRQALTAGSLGAWEIDLETGVAWHSDQLDLIFGYSNPPGRWDLDTMLDHVVADQRDVVRKQLGLTLEVPRVDVDCQIAWRDGSLHWITISGALECNAAGRSVRVGGTVRDITERRSREAEHAALEEQLHRWQRVEMVGRLASGVAHDFNNVLTVVHGWAELIANNTSDGDVQAQARAICGAADHGRQLTDQLLSVGRARTPGEMAVDVNVVVASTVSMVQRLVRNDVHVRVALGPVPSVWIDPTHLSQILLNLAINARDALPCGGEIVIATRNVLDASPPRVEVVVSDNGHGIDPTSQGRLFEPFFTTKDPGAGTGLGLSIVEQLVRRAGGEIVVDSAPGSGATFTMTLPALPAGAQV